MDKSELASVMLRIITKQNFRDQKVKKKLVDLGMISEKYNPTPKGKDLVYEYYSGFDSCVELVKIDEEYFYKCRLNLWKISTLDPFHPYCYEKRRAKEYFENHKSKGDYITLGVI